MSQLTYLSEPDERDDATGRSESSEPEVACTLSKARLAERREELRGGLIPRIRRVRELSDGYAFGLELTATDEGLARDFVAFESGCCGFASYDVVRDEAESVVWLSVRGPHGTKQLFRQLAPESIAIEELPAGDPARDKSLLRAGIAGLGATLVAIVCCATPILAIALGTLGLGTAVAAASLWLDILVAPLLVASLLAIGVAIWRRRTATA